MIKNTIKEIILTNIIWELDGGTLQDAIKHLTELKEIFDAYPDAVLDFHNDDGNYILRLINNRLETDDEAKRRQEKAMEKLLKDDKIIRKQKLDNYERLKKGVRAMTYEQWKANYKQNRPHERLGQAFVNDFIKCMWPDLFNSNCDHKSEELIKDFLIDCNYWPDVPMKVVRV